jgi:AAA ATPase domain
VRDPRFRRQWEEHPPTPDESKERAQHLAQNVALGPVEKPRLDAARDALEGMEGHVWTSFHDAFVEQARANPARARAWVDAIAAAVDAETSGAAPSALWPRDVDAFQHRLQARRDMSDPFDVWRDRWLRREGEYRDHGFMSNVALALRLAPAPALLAMERVPTLDMMELSLLDARTDRELIEAMISTAPPVLLEDGQWAPGHPVTALLVMELIVKHAQALDEAMGQEVWQARNAQSRAETDVAVGAAEAARMAVRNQELPAWMRRVFQMLLERSDGRALALGYLAHLSREVLIGRGCRQEDPWSATASALEALSGVLREAHIRISAFQDAWRADEVRARRKEERRATQRRVSPERSEKVSVWTGEGARVIHGEGMPWLLGAAHVLGDDPRDEAELSGLWSWLEELLSARDDGLSLVLREPTHVADVTQRLGFLVSRVPDWQRRLLEVYHRLEPQRRRSIYGFRYEEIDRDEASVLLLRIGLYAVANGADSQVGDRTSLEETFFWIFDAARRLWLTAVLDTSEQKSKLVPLCFAFVSFVFKERVPQALDRLIPPISNDAAQLCDAAWFFWRNDRDKDATRTQQLFRRAGADLETALRDLRQWSELTGRKEDFSDDLQALAAALSITFEAPASDLGNALVTKERRQELIRGLPWGSALLARIEEAGCVLRRMWPLDASRHVWGLQIELPLTLRADTGLASVLRLLAARGAVRGADLRRLLEDPTDRSLVDADAIVVAGDDPRLVEKVPLLGGPWGQRVAWPCLSGRFGPFVEALHEGLRAVDVFDRRDPVPPHVLAGRQADVQQLAAMLAQGRAVGVLGLRKVGKTSLIRAVAEQLDPTGAQLAISFDRASADETAAEAFVVFLDVQSLTSRTIDAVARVLAERLSTRLKLFRGERPVEETEENQRQEASPLDTLDAALSNALGTTERSVCFLIDEYDLLFEGYGGEPGAAGIERLFALLRSRAQTGGRIGLALVGRDPVFVERPLLSGFTNPLLGWVTTRWLGPLGRAEATALLETLGRRVGLHFGPGTLEAAWRWTGGHPLLLRQFGAAVHECADHISPRPWPVPTDSLVARATRAFRARSMVETACGEIRSLLSARFPEAEQLLKSIAAVPADEVETVVSAQGGEDAKAVRTLVGFGLLLPGVPRWVPELYREAFGGRGLPHPRRGEPV